MKRNSEIMLCVLLTVALLSGCSVLPGQNAGQTSGIKEESSAQTTEENTEEGSKEDTGQTEVLPQPTETLSQSTETLSQPTETLSQSTEMAEKKVQTVTIEEGFANYGYTHFVCETSGTYCFEMVNSDGIEWEVYLLDSEFDDANRYISQAVEAALQGDGTLDIKEGQYIYIHCSINDLTSNEPTGDGTYQFYLE